MWKTNFCSNGFNHKSRKIMMAIAYRLRRGRLMVDMSATRSSRKVYTSAFVVRALVTARYCPARFCPARFCYCVLLSARFCRRGFVLRAFVGSPVWRYQICGKPLTLASWERNGCFQNE